MPTFFVESDKEMKKVLLTGATGFVGKNIVERLSDKYEVISIGSKQHNLIQQHECEDMLRHIRPDLVIHAAGAVGGIGANKLNPGKFMYENLAMGINMIHSSMIHNVEKFVLLGTVCSYPKHTQVPFREEDLWLGYPEETNAPYGIAKKTLMSLLENYHYQYGFNGVNLIPVNMYGPYDHFNLTTSHVIPALILKIQKALESKQKEVILWGTGKASREFLYAPDCAEAVELALEKQIPPDPINIGTGKEITISELMSCICDIMKYSGEIVYDTSKPDGQPRRSLDLTKSRELLGFEAKTDLRAGLEQTIKWFLNNRNIE